MDKTCVVGISFVDRESIELLRPKETAVRLSQLARQAAVFSARKIGYTKEISFYKDEQGVPLPEDGLYWAISHKSTCVAGAVATCALGIDVEKIKPMKKDMYARIAADAEWALMGGAHEDAFFRVWTGKEAVLKMVGVGMKGLSDCFVKSVLNDEALRINYLGNSWDVGYVRLNGHVIAAATDKDRDICWDVCADTGK